MLDRCKHKVVDDVSKQMKQSKQPHELDKGEGKKGFIAATEGTKEWNNKEVKELKHELNRGG